MKRLAMVGDTIHIWNAEYKVLELLEEGKMKIQSDFDGVVTYDPKKPNPDYSIVKTIKPLEIGNVVNTKENGKGKVLGMFGETWVYVGFDNGYRQVYALVGDKYLRVKSIEQENFKYLEII